MKQRQTPTPYNDNRREWNAHARGAWITLWLWQGSKLTEKDIAKLTGMTRFGAKYMMDMLSLWLPIVEVDGKWQWMEKDVD